MPDITAGQNSYVDLATADAHFDSRLHADAWTAATDDTKEKALLMAAILLDGHIRWNGAKAFPDQPLEWPRVGLSWIPAGTVPKSVQLAQMELALLLITKDTTALPDTAGFKSMTVDSLKMEIAPSDRVKAIPDAVFALVQGYGSRAGGLSSITLTRA